MIKESSINESRYIPGTQDDPHVIYALSLLRKKYGNRALIIGHRKSGYEESFMQDHGFNHIDYQLSKNLKYDYIEMFLDIFLSPKKIVFDKIDTLKNQTTDGGILYFLIPFEHDDETLKDGGVTPRLLDQFMNALQEDFEIHSHGFDTQTPDGRKALWLVLKK